MGFFPILIIIIVVVISIANAKAKAKAQAEKARGGQAQGAPARPAQPQPEQARPLYGRPAQEADPRFPDITERPRKPEPDPRFPDITERPRKPEPDPRFPDITAPRPAKASKPEYRGSMAYDSHEGSTTEGGPRVTAPAMHVVKPLTESRHSHMETSMTGIAPDCGPEFSHDLAYEGKAPALQRPALLFDNSSVVNAILYSEILGKPKALRR